MLQHHHSAADRGPGQPHSTADPGPGGPRARSQSRLRLVLCLSIFYMIAEAVGGWLTGSLALLADAGHLLSDVGALGLGLTAMWIAQQPATSSRTYGYTRAEILAALIHGVTLVAVGIVIVIEAVERLQTSVVHAHGLGMMAVASGALLVNLTGVLLLNRSREGNINIRGAWLHLLTDALGSMGVIVAGALVWQFGWYWADSAASIAISLLVLASAWSLLRDAVDILMETAPRHLDVDEIRGSLIDLPTAMEVHDLHVWTIGNGEVALSSHVVASDEVRSRSLLADIHRVLQERFGIAHATIQIEIRSSDSDACDGGCDAASAAAISE